MGLSCWLSTVFTLTIANLVCHRASSSIFPRLSCGIPLSGPLVSLSQVKSNVLIANLLRCYIGLIKCMRAMLSNTGKDNLLSFFKGEKNLGDGVRLAG